MNQEVKISDILNHLEENNYDYTFKGNEDSVIKGFSTLFNYKTETITFISTLYTFKDYEHLFDNKTIRLMLLDPSENVYDSFENMVQVEKPTNAFFSILEKFFTNDSEQFLPIYNKQDNMRKNASISDEANIGNDVKIGHGCVVEPGVIIGDNTEIHHNVVIKNGTIIGENCKIESGTIIGEEGFNPFTLKDGSRKLLKHFGGVVIEDQVNIGAKCNIHKGAIDDTVIKTGVKLNAKVHIAHNSIIGKNTVITMPTIICGSVKIGEKCHIAANTIRNQCNVGDGAVLGLGAVVVKDVEANTTVVGNPAKPLIK